MWVFEAHPVYWDPERTDSDADADKDPPRLILTLSAWNTSFLGVMGMMPDQNVASQEPLYHETRLLVPCLQFRLEFLPNLMKTIFRLFSPPSALPIFWCDTCTVSSPLLLYNNCRGVTLILCTTQVADVDSKSSGFSHLGEPGVIFLHYH